MVDNYRAELGIEMYINLDHSPSVEAARAGIDAGFEFIHIDLSQARKDATDQEIVAATRAVVEYAASSTGALVESEPHYFGGSSNVHEESFDYEEIRKTFSTPEGAKAFVSATGIDTFAAAVGNLHGRYPVPKQLDLELLQRIRDAIDVNISLHAYRTTSSASSASIQRSTRSSGSCHRWCAPYRTWSSAASTSTGRPAALCPDQGSRVSRCSCAMRRSSSVSSDSRTGVTSDQ